MKADLIAIGGSYVVKGSHGRGRAVVTGPSSGTGRHVYFPVTFPDAKHIPNNEVRYPSREFLRPWSEDDQEAFNDGRRRSAEIDAIEIGLESAGYKPTFVRSIRDGLYIGFEGDSADRVKELLLANPYVEPTRELTAGES